MSILDRLIEITEKVNGAASTVEHHHWDVYRSGFLDALKVAGYNAGTLLMNADLHYIDQGCERPMCGGVFLDWKPEEGG